MWRFPCNTAIINREIKRTRRLRVIAWTSDECARPTETPLFTLRRQMQIKPPPMPLKLRVQSDLLPSATIVTTCRVVRLDCRIYITYGHQYPLKNRTEYRYGPDDSSTTVLFKYCPENSCKLIEYGRRSYYLKVCTLAYLLIITNRIKITVRSTVKSLVNSWSRGNVDETKYTGGKDKKKKTKISGSLSAVGGHSFV